MLYKRLSFYLRYEMGELVRMDMKELRCQHADIMAAAHALAIAVQDETAPQPIASLRWRLARRLITHLAVEDGHFYPAMMKSMNSATCTTAKRFQFEMGALAASFTAYMSAWTDAQIAADWPKFCNDTRAILAALERRVAQEEKHLYPLAASNWKSAETA